MEQRHREQGSRAMARVAQIASCTAVAALALGLAACGSSSKNAGTPKSSKSAGAGAVPSVKALPVPKVTHVQVTDTDRKMTLSVTHYSPGNYNFTLKNAGHAKHALTINGPGLRKQTGATVTAGQSTDLIVPLVKGTYQVWSPVGGDRAAGMQTTITVS